MGYESCDPHKKTCLSYRLGLNMPFLRNGWPDCGNVPPPRVWLTPIGKAAMMIKKKVLDPDRIRCIHGGFSFIPHRFLTDGFLVSLPQKEILLYLFLVLASDRHGLSFYSYDTICSLLQMDLDQYINARNGLIEKDLIAFDGTVFQVMELPATPVLSSASKHADQKRARNQATIAQLADQSLKRMTP
jgi:hypothetical protein